MVAKTKLKVGKIYIFEHQRKGQFFAKVLGYKKQAKKNYLHVEIDTSEGSGQEHLAHAVHYDEKRKVSAPLTETLLLLPLISKVNKFNGSH